MIVVATSGRNQCIYCVVAHGATLRIYEKKPLVAAFFGLSKHIANLTAMRPNDEFYLMGRVPKAKA